MEAHSLLAQSRLFFSVIAQLGPTRYVCVCASGPLSCMCQFYTSIRPLGQSTTTITNYQFEMKDKGTNELKKIEETKAPGTLFAAAPATTANEAFRRVNEDPLLRMRWVLVFGWWTR